MALTEKRQKFIEDIAALVKKYARQYGIMVHSPVIAQAILESGWGESRLAAEYHNYFGLKCGSKWTGRSVNMTTKEEYQLGTLTTIKDNFRAYDSMEEGVKGYFEFIQYARYQNLKGITDPREYLQTIKDDGYATSSKYVENTYRVVTEYGLTKYDKEETGMTIAEQRQAVINYLVERKGIKEGSAEHRTLLALFNDSGLCTRYKMTTNDPWCATGASAAYIAAGLGDIFPVECSCGKMIEIGKEMDIFIEEDDHIPEVAEAVLYDWGDSGNGDNTGWPDHVGLAKEVNREQGYIIVIEANINNTIGERKLEINGKYIRGFIAPNFTGTVEETPAAPAQKKSVAEVAKEVLNGKWGNGAERKERLAAAGYDYSEVQAEVNRLVNGTGKPKPTKSVAEVAKEVLAGKWGNGSERKAKLEAEGYNYTEVQNAVNALVKSSQKPTTPKKSVTEIAKEVINGKWGNGADRKKKLEAAGYDYKTVQKKVNELLK